jgi:hypothetical protein
MQLGGIAKPEISYGSISKTVNRTLSVEKRIEVLLAEYDACHKNRDHYDIIRWTIASIFAGASIAIFGASFLEPALDSPYAVVLLTVLSLVLLGISAAYHEHVDPWVRISLDRAFEIENELRTLGFGTQLHSE